MGVLGKLRGRAHPTKSDMETMPETSVHASYGYFRECQLPLREEIKDAFIYLPPAADQSLTS